MGWVNAVDFIQEAHMRMVTNAAPDGAGLDIQNFLRMGSPGPRVGGETPRSWFSVYVDNFDQGKVILIRDRHRHEFHASGEQLAVREAYLRAGVERDPDKAAEGVPIWQSLGTELRGLDGLVGTSAKRRAHSLGLILDVITRTDVSEDQLLGAIGKCVFIGTFARPTLALFSDEFLEAERHARRSPISLNSSEELLLFAMLLPTMWMNVRARVASEVLATDASEEGGGACVSIGL